MELTESEEPEGHAKAVPTSHSSIWGFIRLRGMAPPPGRERFTVQLERGREVQEERQLARCSVGAWQDIGRAKVWGPLLLQGFTREARLSPLLELQIRTVCL